MKKIVLLAFVLVLLSTAVVVGFIRPVEAGATIYIRADGSVEGTTDISTVDNVTYTFTDNIFNQSIIVERDNIVVDGAGYTLQGLGSGKGINMTGRSNVTIRNMEIKAFRYGIWLEDSSNSSISGNNITANDFFGIQLRYSSNNSISGNTITNNGASGVYLVLSSGNSISGNTITNNNEMGVRLYSSSYNTVSRNTITNNRYSGILIYYDSSNCSVLDNNVTKNETGIWVEESSNCSISGNSATKNQFNGIELVESSNNAITGNNITNNWDSGIDLDESSNYNTISGNNITNNWDSGTTLSLSSNNSICGNNITNNWGSIRVSSSSNNSIYGNNMANQLCGIHLSGNSSDNKFYHNNFINNTHHVFILTSGYANFWDDGYPSGGNYWSNYNGTDLYSGPYQDVIGSDGIGDTSYDVDVNNQDGFPLMGPISFFNAGTWDETTYYVHTVSNSTVSDFHFSVDDKLVSFNVTGPDDTVGFCRVTIPNELLWCDNPEQWEVWVNNTLIEDRKIMEDTRYTYIYFTYNQSTQNVEVMGVHVIPEFPTWTSMLLILILLTVATAIYKRRLPKTPIH